MKDYIAIIIGAVVAIVVFAILWRRGSFVRISTYFRETQDELKKCTWPTVDELKGSTVVVMVSIALLGGFTVLIDFVIAMMVRWIT
jgi:preprotein translocase subunit SecE